jgi:hypothetical protein
LKNTQTNLSQLYVAGCGFEFISHANQDDENCPADIIATYTEGNHYKFFYPKTSSQKVIEKMPAIIRRAATSDTKTGGVFLSGTHIETCVRKSKLLKFFSPDGTPDNKKILLNAEDYRILEESQEKTAIEVVSLLKETFKTN